MMTWISHGWEIVVHIYYTSTQISHGRLSTAGDLTLSPSLTNRKFHQGDKQQTTDDRYSNYRLNQSEGRFSGNFKYLRNICLVPLPFRRFSLFFHSIFIEQPLDMPCLLNVKTQRIWIFSKKLFSFLKKCLSNVQWGHGGAIQANNYSRRQPDTSCGQTVFFFFFFFFFVVKFVLILILPQMGDCSDQ